MLSELEQYDSIDRLNELLEPLSYLNSNYFALYTIETLQPLLLRLPSIREIQIRDLLAEIKALEDIYQNNAIGNKARLIKADVLEWSDKSGTTNQNELAGLRGSKLRKLRVLFGLKSIEAILVQTNLSTAQNNGMMGALYRS